jgi:glutathione peroxidase
MSVYDTSLNSLDGDPGILGEQKGNVTLLVNVASFCGLTPQYEGLEKLYERFGAQGFSVVGVPCNQFVSRNRAPRTRSRRSAARTTT